MKNGNEKNGKKGKPTAMANYKQPVKIWGYEVENREKLTMKFIEEM